MKMTVKDFFRGIILIMASVCFIVSCSQNGNVEIRRSVEEINNDKNASEIEKFLGGEHLLYTVFDTSYLISDNTFITFAWKMNNGQMSMNSAPIDKFRFEKNESVTTPYVKFRWRNCGWDQQKTFDYYLVNDYIVYILVVSNKNNPSDLMKYFEKK